MAGHTAENFEPKRSTSWMAWLIVFAILWGTFFFKFWGPFFGFKVHKKAYFGWFVFADKKNTSPVDDRIDRG